MVLASRQWDPLGLARRLPSLEVGAWRSVQLLPWRVQCPVRVCVAPSAGSGGSGRYLVLCLSRFPLPTPRVPLCMWQAGRCPLPSLAGTPFHAVCAFRELGPVALLVVPACPLRVCALALPPRPLPSPLGGVACEPRAVPALGAGRAVPRGPCPSACPVPVPCSVWRALGGAVRSRFPPTWLGAVRPPWGRSVAFVCRGAGWGGGAARAPCPPICAPWGASRAGGRSASLRPSAFPGQATKRLSLASFWSRGAWPPHCSGSCSPASLGAICAASWRVGAGSLVPRGSFGSGRLGRGGGPCSGSSLGRGEGGPSALPRGMGAGAPAACGPVGGMGGGGRAAASLLPLPGEARSSLPWPPSCRGRTPPRRARSVGLAGPPRGGGGEGRPVDRSPGGPFRPEPSLCPPRVGNGHGGGHAGRGPHTVLVRRRVLPPSLVRAPLRRAGVGLPVGRDPRGSGRLGALGRAVCRSSRIPPLPRCGPFWGRGGVPSAPGGRRVAPVALKLGGGGVVRPLRRPLPPRPVGRRPAIRCLRRAPPGVYSRRGGCGAAVGVRRGPVGRQWVSAAGAGGGRGGEPPCPGSCPRLPQAGL